MSCVNGSLVKSGNRVFILPGLGLVFSGFENKKKKKKGILLIYPENMFKRPVSLVRQPR